MEPIFTPREYALSDKCFYKLSSFIESNFGIKMPESKRVMLQSRLQKRLRELKMESFEEYADYLFSPGGFDKELINMLNVVTTNKTDFFREPAHFDILLNHVIPDLKANHNFSRTRKLKVWSAGCSSGEEPYTLAMVLNKAGFTPREDNLFLLATDLSTAVLHKAIDAIYDSERAAPVPLDYKKQFFLKSKDSKQQLVRIRPEIRRMVYFKRFNLIQNRFSGIDTMDIIFCRNVIIYFNKDIQTELIRKFYDRLNPGGYLFLGHSETLCNSNIPFRSVAPTVYKKV